ncbi:MAG: hypothetical protein IPH12_10685 [Saprospirales bacterium]|nr:hypothetical protein [Saprospirales bacterium]MBK8922278.1 hypothetical protein [Saprospirales bacterium]
MSFRLVEAVRIEKADLYEGLGHVLQNARRPGCLGHLDGESGHFFHLLHRAAQGVQATQDCGGGIGQSGGILFFFV